MAKHDITIIRGGGAVQQFLVDDRTTSSDIQILPGEPVKKSNANYVAHVGDGEPTITAPMWGIATSTSTETSTAEGVVNVQQVIPGKTVLRAKANTGSNLAAGILQDAVTLDRTGSTAYSYTVDENEGDDPNVHGLIIVDYDADKDTVDFIVKSYATEQGSSY